MSIDMNIVLVIKRCFLATGFVLFLSWLFFTPVYALDIGAVADRLSTKDEILMDGLTSPYAEVVILNEKNTEELIVVGEVEADGEFSFKFKYNKSDLNDLKIFGIDQIGVTSRLMVTSLLDKKFILPPTIVNDGSDKGDKNLVLMGYTYPKAEVEIELKKEGAQAVSFKVIANSTDGQWNLNKADLPYGKYVGKARSRANGLISEWSQDIFFEIPLVETPAVVDKLWFSSLLASFPALFLLISSLLLLVALSEWSLLLLLLRGLRSLLFLFGFKRKDKSGVVYDTYTKKPLEGALVSLWNDKCKRIHIDVTGDDGEFYIPLLPQGKYKISCLRNDYKFPSTLVRGKGRDSLYVDLYHGEEIVAKDKHKISISIPMDRLSGDSSSTLRQLLRKYGHYLSWSWLALCIVVSVLNLIYEPGIVSLLFIAYYLCLVGYLLFDLTLFYGYSIVFDSSGAPMPEVSLYVHSMPSLELVAIRVTDEDGKFYLKLDEGEYRISFEPGLDVDWERSNINKPIFKVKDGYLKLKVVLV